MVCKAPTALPPIDGLLYHSDNTGGHDRPEAERHDGHLSRSEQPNYCQYRPQDREGHDRQRRTTRSG